MTSIAVNTDEEEIETMEKNLEVDTNGHIHPRKNEVIVEMALSHSAKNWNDVKEHISENLQLSLKGNPWISNNGRHYMTVGFRTNLQDF